MWIAWRIIIQARKTASTKAQNARPVCWAIVRETGDETRDIVRSQMLWEDKINGIFSNGTIKPF